jgi:predicted NUDIX family NTP pyrophosphohydrolase
VSAARSASAGLLLYRLRGGVWEVLLAHPGGPFFRNKDAGAWSLPKGELEVDEEPLSCALREFREETGIVLGAQAEVLSLGEIKQRGGKRVWGFACEGDYDGQGPPPSNTFEIEWPPRSGKRASFPEIDRLEFFDLTEARLKILPAQEPFLDRLLAALAPS